MGYFDPTAGILANAYGLGPNTVPKYSVNVDSIMNFIGFEKVLLNNRSVKLKKGMYLDFNAIAKGYCVDLLSNALMKNNITNHLIEIGGEMYASGINNITNTRWKVGISDPLKPDDTKQKIFLKNIALASSGNYRKFLINRCTCNKWLFHSFIEHNTCRSVAHDLINFSKIPLIPN